MGPGGKKLSKRRDPVSVQDYQEEGYLPQALCNWLIRIGWSHGDQEVFSSREIAYRSRERGAGRPCYSMVRSR